LLSCGNPSVINKQRKAPTRRAGGLYKVLEPAEEGDDSRKGGLFRLIFNTPLLNGNISNTNDLLQFPRAYLKHSLFVDMFYVTS